jgi:hypothetical protein
MTYIFPAENGGTLDTVDVPDSVVASGHLTVIGFAFHNIDTGIKSVRWTWISVSTWGSHALEKICATMLAIESLARSKHQYST